MSRRKPNLTLSTPETTLQVLDMGLDFRSYLSRVDDSGIPVLGNVISYEASKIPDVFEPTVGLLVTILHMYTQSNSTASAFVWLKTYESIQKVYLDHVDQENNETARYATEARLAILSHLSGGMVTDGSGLYEKLLLLLDQQSGIRGAQAPSQRKVPREPKGAFCNLHLADQKCYQDFACNQLHLHEAGPVRHRINFFMRLIEVLKAEKRSKIEILHRIKDSIFFARYGNKVTVQCHGKWIPFFKTVYTDGRLEQAFRMQQFSCNNNGCSDEHCKGIHAQERRVVSSSRQVDLHNPQALAIQIEDEGQHLLSLAGVYKNQVSEPPPSLSLSSPMVTIASPTSELWRSTVREYVRQTGIPQLQADESLLRTLQDANVVGTPAASTESLTPLLDELELHAFNSNTSPRNES
ncbi:zinc finger CCCH domain containing protein 17 [Trypanosoma cruzi]|nr:zinc finger CCCH domain containing protein 17 [Trypanosoma cruzi]